MAVQGGYQGALMAPTEVLAEQLHAVATATLSTLMVPSEGTLLAERPVTVALLTNKVGVGRSAQDRRGARPPARSTSWWARTRCSTATRRSPSSGSR